MDSCFFISGLCLLFFGAGWLVKGSSDLARSMGMTPLVIGLTVVAFGTSAPEMLVSVVSSFKDKSMIAVGNVVGSNICNIGLVLGVTALFNPVKSSASVARREMPLMLFILLYFIFLALDSKISRLEGIVLFTGVILYTIFNYYTSKNNFSNELEKEAFKTAAAGSETVSSRSKQILLIIAGIAGVVTGADFVVDSAVKIMKILGVNEKFIGLTVIAFGTSLPELSTSVVAAIRNELEISLGNLVGSNVFNILGVLGAAAIVRPICIQGGFIESGLLTDCLVMVFISFLPILMMIKTCTISRGNGLLLLLSYSAYLVYLVYGA